MAKDGSGGYYGSKTDTQKAKEHDEIIRLSLVKALSGEKREIQMPKQAKVADLKVAIRAFLEIGPPLSFGVACTMESLLTNTDTSGQTVQIAALLKSENERSLHKVGLVSGMTLLLTRTRTPWCWARPCGEPCDYKDLEATSNGVLGAVLVIDAEFPSTAADDYKDLEATSNGVLGAVLVIDAEFPSTAADLLSFLSADGKYKDAAAVLPEDGDEVAPWKGLREPLNELHVVEDYYERIDLINSVGDVTMQQLLGMEGSREEVEAVADQCNFYTGSFSFEDDFIITENDAVVICTDSNRKLIRFAWNFESD
eukprot:CAMPEP_0197706778 /NCGR_PEP_ID=MMETSP1338-20131121/127119_1 /TAXON_ID=43686 ORGANISM="Pelagodinium beii, Strain RCC1491" /NCGR_SAMPLE_ID=MMETSP1338 /ASSEMBLY_ACC=CAM_ASM_000754 /LENGTH=310 /DNA_ID=CAMNT_0043290695 /DNA_START=16 /DNA_END=949 /DNA_ORIENTATION=-